MTGKLAAWKLTLYHCWLDSAGREHRMIAKRGTVRDFNVWAKKHGLLFKKDRSLFGGVYLGPSGDWYEVR